MLTARQEWILCKVVDEYLQTAQPVASRLIAADPALDCAPSTVRNELAVLEELGLLSHPHVSAGRVPTESGQRYVVDRLLRADGSLPSPPRRLELSRICSEIDEAVRTTSETLSRMTNLVAVVSAPSLNSSTIRHVEVLALQPQLVLIVIITSTGSVSKMLASFERAVDPGLLAWASEYLNERLVGLALGARMVQQRLLDPGLSASELAFLERFVLGFGELANEGEDAIYVEGTARLLEEGMLGGGTRVTELVDLLERRVALLRVLRTALSESGVYVRIGRENELPAMQSLAFVAAGYGARRKLGAVSVIGPVRMDYAAAIANVREAAHELSRFVENSYGEN